MDAFVKASGGQIFSVGGEGDGVHGLRMFGERVDAVASLHVPEADRRVKRGAEKFNSH